MTAIFRLRYSRTKTVTCGSYMIPPSRVRISWRTDSSERPPARNVPSSGSAMVPSPATRVVTNASSFTCGTETSMMSPGPTGVSVPGPLRKRASRSDCRRSSAFGSCFASAIGGSVFSVPGWPPVVGAGTAGAVRIDTAPPAG